jgi:hypothetical protein
LTSATLDFVNAVISRDPDDRRGLVEFVQALRSEQLEQYLALLTTDGPRASAVTRTRTFRPRGRQAIPDEAAARRCGGRGDLAVSARRAPAIQRAAAGTVVGSARLEAVIEPRTQSRPGGDLPSTDTGRTVERPPFACA